MGWRYWRRFDWLLLATAAALAALGCLMIHSATQTIAGLSHYDSRQGWWIAAGMVVFGLALIPDLDFWRKWSGALYGVVLLLLFAVLLPGVGRVVSGGQRWIDLGPVRLQPSEFAKPVLVLTLAALHSSPRFDPRRWRTLIVSLCLVALPTVLVFLERDLGSAMVFLALWLGMVWVAGARRSHLAVVVFLGLVLGGFVWKSDVIRPYQKQRLTVFLHPRVSPRDIGYHAIQSEIAIGSGGLTGKGIGKGTQGQLRFIPEQHTDFIFTVVGEETGFAGAVLVLALYLLLLWRALSIAESTDDAFGRLVAVGVLCVLAFHTIVNTGMTMRIMPITGLPLPLLSYGGSNVIGVLLGLSLLESVSMRRRRISF